MSSLSHRCRLSTSLLCILVAACTNPDDDPAALGDSSQAAQARAALVSAAATKQLRPELLVLLRDELDALEHAVQPDPSVTAQPVIANIFAAARAANTAPYAFGALISHGFTLGFGTPATEAALEKLNAAIEANILAHLPTQQTPATPLLAQYATARSNARIPLPLRVAGGLPRISTAHAPAVRNVGRNATVELYLRLLASLRDGDPTLPAEVTAAMLRAEMVTALHANISTERFILSRLLAAADIPTVDPLLVP